MIEFAMAESKPNINMNKLETRFTIGNVEKPIEQKIEETAKKIIESKIFKKEGFENEETRSIRADEVIASMGFGGIDSYKKMVDTFANPSSTDKQKENANNAFDVLKKSVSIAMNSGIDQELQTTLNLGAEKVRDVFPEVFNYTNNGVLETDLAESVVDVSITEPSIKEGLKRLDKIRSRVDESSKVESFALADKMESEVIKLLEIEIDDDKEHELMGIKSYLNTEAAVLREKFSVKDGSVDSADVSAILGEKMDKFVDKVSEVIEKNSSEAVHKRVAPRAKLNDDGEFDGYEPNWIVSEDKAAEAMKFMAGDLRWSSWTPPEWFKRKEGDDQWRVELMVMINEGASWLAKYQNSDIDRCRLNPLYGSFDRQKFSKLFNEDFKLVTSKMLHDLCEFYTNSDGIRVLRYKEGYDSNYATEDFKPLYIRKSVEDKLFDINKYKDELADFLAKQNNRISRKDINGNLVTEENGIFYVNLEKEGKKVKEIFNGDVKDLIIVPKPNAEDRMNAYTAWNLWFMMGDSSYADRLRVIPPKTGLISDKFRTLNPESKAIKKWKVKHRFNAKADTDMLDQAEWFGGPISSYVMTVQKMERQLGVPLDGKKTLQDKLIDGDMEIFSNTTCYGMFDVIDNKSLCNKDGVSFMKLKEEVSLSQLLWNYAEFDENGELKQVNSEKDFSFGDVQMDCLSDFRDMQEASVRTFNLMTGKVEIKNEDAWINEINTTAALANGLLYNGKRLFGYTKRPEFWAVSMLASYGVDLTRLSSERIYVKLPEKIPSDNYPLYLHDFLTSKLVLSGDVNIAKVLNYLGCKGENASNPLNVFNTSLQRTKDLERTIKIKRKIGKEIFVSAKTEMPFTEEYISRTNEMKELYKNWKRAVEAGNVVIQDRLLKEMIRISDGK